jgi:lysophospholipase L1-like esterase
LRQRIEKFLVAIGISVLLILSLEAGARCAFFLADDVLHVGATESKAGAPAFAMVDYDAVALIREQEALPSVAYRPYVVWESRPTSGRYFNVGEDGLRRTHYNSDSADALQVWMFGGSTMFGYGAPDDETIASHLARRMNQALGPTRVRNFGQGGWVSTQELIRLLRELQTGRRPDLVVFYDGYNDSVSARNWPQVPGSHFQLEIIRGRYESGVYPLLVSSSLFRATGWVLGRLGLRLPVEDETAPSAAAGDLAARVWLANADQAAALAGHYGFQVGSFLQPSRLTETMPPHVPDVGPAPTDNKMSRMRDRVNEWRTAHPEAPVFDLTDVFADVPEAVYIDGVHVTGLGNSLVAEALLRQLAPTLTPSLAAPDATRDPETPNAGPTLAP